jgi:hypothetical protein
MWIVADAATRGRPCRHWRKRQRGLDSRNYLPLDYRISSSTALCGSLPPRIIVGHYAVGTDQPPWPCRQCHRSSSITVQPTGLYTMQPLHSAVRVKCSLDRVNLCTCRSSQKLLLSKRSVGEGGTRRTESKYLYVPLSCMCCNSSVGRAQD